MRPLFFLPLAGCAGSGLMPELSVADRDHDRACTTPTESDESGFVFERGAGDRPACTVPSHAIAGARGQWVEFTLAQWEGADSATLLIRDWNGSTIERVEGLAPGDSVTFPIPWTGEQRLSLVPEGDDGGGAYRFELECLNDCNAAWSRYPFMVMHGFGSSENAFEDMIEAIEGEGYVARAFSVDKFDSSQVRAGQWRAHLDQWQANGRFRGVHLIGHSMGGLDARYLASHLDPERRVKSITTLSTPHWGTPLADIALDLVDHDYSPEEIGEMVQAIAPEGEVTGSDGRMAAGIDGLTAALYQLSEPGALFFNQTTPDREDVIYRSWTGMTCGQVDLFCQWDWDMEMVAAVLTPTFGVMSGLGLPSDGVVDVFSGQWGGFQGILAADHFEMGGGRPFAWPSFDDDGFFAREAHRMAYLEFAIELEGESQSRSMDELWDLDW